MEKNYIRSNKLSTIVNDLYKSNVNTSFTEIFKLFEQSKKKFDDNIYNIFLIYSRNVNDINDIIALCYKKNIKFTESLYSTIIKSYCLLLDVDKSEKFFVIMKNNKIKLKQRTYTHFIAMYNKINNYDKLLEIYKEIKSNNVKLLTCDYINLINSFLKHKNIEIITELFKEIENNDICFEKKHIDLLKKSFQNSNYLFKLTTISDNGLCQINKILLKPIDITQNERIEMMITFDIQIPDNKLKLFKKFKQWLFNHIHIDIVIDGANIGYFNNRPDKKNSLDFKQIENVRFKLNKMGYNTIIILHQRHTKNMTNYQNLLYKSWLENNQLYITPIGIDDDIFWLYTSLYSSSYIVTNDRMKDHHFNISHNKIVRWKKKYIINYEIVQKKLPKLCFPKKYSETVQNINKYLWYFPFNIEENNLQWIFTNIE